MTRCMIAMVFVAALLAGCDIYTATTVKQMDQNAAAARVEANKANQGQLGSPDMAYDLECFARGYENLSQAGHFKQPLYTGAPTTRPTTLPWTPVGGANPKP